MALKAISFLSIVLAVAAVKLIKMDNAIDSQYVVVFTADLETAQQDAHIAQLTAATKGDAFGSSVLRTFRIGSFSGYAARLSPALFHQEMRSKDIAYIEQDARITAFQACSQQSNSPWGVDRIAQQKPDLDGMYQYNAIAGEGVDAYVIDTGINIDHVDFAGRATWGGNFVDQTNTDCNGHGTHVAGTIGSQTYGVAKKVSLIAVKVLDCTGSGTNSGVIDGINWVASNYAATGKKPSLANMSLGGGFSSALNAAITAVVAEGVTFAVAAGNDDKNSCDYSPASLGADGVTITVGATDIDADASGAQLDNRAYFSNYGKCVTIFAPGVLIASTWIGPNNNEIKTISGTSMATPHVAGVIAMYLGENPQATPAQVKQFLEHNGTSDIVRLDCAAASKEKPCHDTVNLFMYNPCSSA
eukprot:TRINITY_DN1820_c0_g2_i1.p1 TRINITY_DN1820_c0_g2~~TRINITY_DN1820_c0_g2_i1.p1  ORF type:complete len:432 (+),score=109.15 TRINITY_DN1820_c0_g2_i1:52-1296(+)